MVSTQAFAWANLYRAICHSLKLFIVTSRVIDLTASCNFIIRMWSLTSRLVHFCFWLRCLIYKVHASALADSLDRLPYLFQFVNTFFQGFFKLSRFLYLFFAFQPPSWKTALIDYHICILLSRTFFVLSKKQISWTLQMLKVMIWYQICFLLSTPFSTFLLLCPCLQ